MGDQQTRFVSEELLPERTLMFKRLIWSMLGLIAAVFVLMLWVLSDDNPNSGNVGNVGQQAAVVGTWPDGSAKTRQDLAAQPAQPGQPPAQPGG
jgi:hypothetical protein